MRRPDPRLCLTVAAAALLAGCGSGNGGNATSSTTRTTEAAGAVIDGFHVLAVVDVHETEHGLHPSTIGFQRIGYFGFRAVNDGMIPHALAVSGPGVSERTGSIPPGKSEAIAVYFRKPGVYRLYSPLDGRTRGMTAVVRVL
jgi:hypothetical protein